MSASCASSSAASASCASRFSASSAHIFWRVKRASSARERPVAAPARARAPCGTPHGVLGAAEPLVVDLRDRGVERLALARVVRLLDAALDDADEVVPPLRAREELLERRERLGVRRVERQHLVVALRRAVDVAEALVDPGDAHPVVARQERVGEARRQLVVEGDELGCSRPTPRRCARSRRASRRAPDRRVSADARTRERVGRVVHALGADARRLALERDALLERRARRR